MGAVAPPLVSLLGSRDVQGVLLDFLCAMVQVRVSWSSRAALAPLAATVAGAARDYRAWIEYLVERDLDEALDREVAAWWESPTPPSS